MSDQIVIPVLTFLIGLLGGVSGMMHKVNAMDREMRDHIDAKFDDLTKSISKSNARIHERIDGVDKELGHLAERVAKTEA